MLNKYISTDDQYFSGWPWPHVSILPYNRTPYEGFNVSITAKINSDISTTLINWKVTGGHLPSTAKHRDIWYSDDDAISILSLYNLQHNDSGKYQIVVMDKHGISEAVASIDVQNGT